MEKNTAYSSPMVLINSPGGISSAITTIGPELMSVVASGGTYNKAPMSQMSAQLPVLNPASRSCLESVTGGAAPLTIFYNGAVVVFNLEHDKAEGILKMVATGNEEGVVEEKWDGGEGLLEKLNNGDLPMARKKSLQRFLEKRKERLITSQPYAEAIHKSSVAKYMKM